MKPLLTSLLLVICFCSITVAQESDNKLKKAADNGTPVPTVINVGDSVRASAVIIPRVDARRIFGAEIANNYAVIEVNIGNKSPDASLIIHGIFIDYSNWALRGGNVSLLKSEIDQRYQSATSPNQVASEEYRVVRGQFLDAKNWSKREWTMRLLTFAASLASGYAFSIKETGILKGIDAFGGIGVPGMREVWPDSTVEQLNNISDFGFRANRAIPKQGSEIIVAFFPIERFLTPGFKKLYLKSPALFVAPLQTLLDKKIQKDVISALNLGSAADFERLNQALPCYMSVEEWRVKGNKFPDFDYCLKQLNLTVDEKEEKDGKRTLHAGAGGTLYTAFNFLNAVSLNNVMVVIDGVMSVETTAIAANIDAISFDDVANCGADDAPCFWTDTEAGEGLRTGKIEGKYLKGGTIVIEDAADLGITDSKTIPEGSDDGTLRFSFKMNKAISAPTLKFKVTKPNPANADKLLESNLREFSVHHAVPGAPEITEVKQDDPDKGKLTITGDGFFDSPTFPLTVKFVGPNGKQTDAKIIEKHRAKLVVEMPAGPAGCWTLTASLGKSIDAKLHDIECFCFFIAPSPKLNSATLDGRRIILAGKDLVPTQECGGPVLDFKISKEKQTVKFQFGQDIFDGNKLILRLMDGEPDIDESWSVKMLLNGTAIEENGTAAIKKKPKPSP